MRDSSCVRAGAAAVLVSIALAGCGGGGGGHHDDPLAEVPSEASADTGGFIAYLRRLVALQPDDREPVAVDALTPPASDTAEPEPLG